jgi:hypothetical protein
MDKNLTTAQILQFPTDHFVTRTDRLYRDSVDEFIDHKAKQGRAPTELELQKFRIFREQIALAKRRIDELNRSLKTDT